MDIKNMFKMQGTLLSYISCLPCTIIDGSKETGGQTDNFLPNQSLKK